MWSKHFRNPYTSQCWKSWLVFWGPNLGVSKNMASLKWMVKNRKPYENGWFGGTTIFGNPKINDWRIIPGRTESCGFHLILPCCMDFCPLRIGLVPFSYMAMILTTGSSHGMILRSAFGKNQLPYHIARSFFWPRVTKIKGRSVNGSWDKSTHLAIYKDIIKLLYMLAFIFETSKRYLDHNPLYTLNNQGPCFIAQRTWSTWVPYTSDTQACFFQWPHGLLLGTFRTASFIETKNFPQIMKSSQEFIILIKIIAGCDTSLFCKTQTKRKNPDQSLE